VVATKEDRHQGRETRLSDGRKARYMPRALRLQSVALSEERICLSTSERKKQAHNGGTEGKKTRPDHLQKNLRRPKKVRCEKRSERFLGETLVAGKRAKKKT